MEKGKMRKAVIISCNDGYNYSLRTKFIERIFNEMDYEVLILSSDFDHRTKEEYMVKRKGLHLIKSIRYRKNISLMRIISLVDFSKKARKYVERLQPDFIYVSGPPNYLYKEFSKYKKKHKNVLVGAEVGDMWPESVPISGTLRKLFAFPMFYWRGLREKYLDDLDFVITECGLFEEQIKKYVSSEKINTLFFCKDLIGEKTVISKTNGAILSLVYLGSINNIIDTDFINKFCRELVALHQKVNFHIIGIGEQKEKLINELLSSSVNVIDHGAIFDDIEKKTIMDECHFALNIMKDTVCVGMTMKSMDYFQNGIPIINNIKGDIWNIIECEKVGLNVDKEGLPDTVRYLSIMKDKQYQTLRNNTKQYFKKELSYDSFRKKFLSILGSLKGFKLE